jgi:uncharacterized LabA/DUF88 family protein
VPARLVIFLDYQNVYSIARAYFHPALAPAQAGQIDPLRLGEAIATKSSDRELAQVRVYRGRPDSEKDPRGYGANLRQCTRWERDPGVKVIWRTLRYPRNWPEEKEEEKGIDVALAIDFVTMAVRGEYDVGVIMSTDTDLKPALEAVGEMGGNPYPRAEVAAWSTPEQHSRRLSIPGRRLWCHWLDEPDYRSVADPTDYTRP